MNALIRRLERVRLTRESLIKMGLGIFGGFILLSIVFSALGWGPSLEDRVWRQFLSRGLNSAEKTLAEGLREDPESGEKAWLLLASFESYAAIPFDDVDLPKILEGNTRRDDTPFLSSQERDELFQLSPMPIEILRAWRDADDVDLALSHLSSLETLEAHIASGEIALSGGKPLLALSYFEKSLAEAPGNTRAVTGWIQTLEDLDREDEVAEAVRKPEIRRAIDSGYLWRYHRDQKEYFLAFFPLIFGQYEYWTLPLGIAVLAIGLSWMLMAFHLGQGWHWSRSLRLLVPVAFFFGWVSAELTLGTVIIVDDLMGPEFDRGLLYHIANAFMIGLREEFWKLVMFLPLLPILVKRGSEVQALTLASIVGLGFAILENGNYYLGSQGSGILGRYLTANFAHMALTGYAGYFAFRAFRYRTAVEWQGAGVAFAKVITIHALYDLFLIAPQLMEWNILSMIIFILMAREYLRLAFYIRPNQRTRVSMTRVFFACLATATGIHFFYLSTKLGIGAGLWHTFGGLLGVVVFCFMYFQEFNERVE